jgi:hypothetical protein
MSKSQKKKMNFGDMIPNHLQNVHNLNMTAPVDYSFSGVKPSRMSA